MRSGIWQVATTKVMIKSSMRKGYMVRQGDVQGPAVATGTTVTSAYSDRPWVTLSWIPATTSRYKFSKGKTLKESGIFR